jgi:hypothetical protein
VEVLVAPFVEVGGELAQRIRDQLLLRAPPAVDRVPADAGAFGDRVDRRALEAALGEQLEGRLDDLGPGGGPTRAPARTGLGFGTLRYRNILSYENV